MIQVFFDNLKLGLELNEFSFALMIKTLARGISKARNEISQKPLDDEDAIIAKSSEESTISEISNKDGPKDHSAIIHNKSTDDSEKNILSIQDKFAALDDSQVRVEDMYEKATSIWNHLIKEESTCISIHVLNAYLKVLCNMPATTESFSKALEFFKEEYSKRDLNPEGSGYLSLLNFVIRNPEVFKKYGPSLWREFLEWDNSKELAFQRDTERLTEIEKEQIRVSENRGKDELFAAFILTVRGYTKAGDVDAAVDLLKASQTFRSIDYLRPVFFKDIWVLVKRARDDSEDGKWKLAQQLSEICPHPNIDPLQAVQKTMKQKFMPDTWWGWKAVGLDMMELKRLQKKNRMIRSTKRG